MTIFGDNTYGSGEYGVGKMSIFGYNTIGGSTNTDGGAFIEVSKETLNEDGAVSKLTLYADGGTSGASSIRAVIYADSSGNPDALLGTGTTTSIAAAAPAAWIDLVFPSAVSLTAGTYWIGMHFGGTASFNHYYDTLSNNLKYASQVYSSGPKNPFGTPQGTLSQRMSIYATYTTTSSHSSGGSSQANLIASQARRPHRGTARTHRR